MSANRATNPRLGFHRWVASLKREGPSAASATNARLSAPPPAAPTAPPAASTAPPGQRSVSSSPAPRAEHDDATRVHHIPREIIQRMRARAASEAPQAPQDERTCVFRAPPELLERAKRPQATSDLPGELLPTEHDFGETLEAKSGISLRRLGRPLSGQPVQVPGDVEEPHDAGEPLGDETDAAKAAPSAGAPLQPYPDAPALVDETGLELLSKASIERPSDAPSFRQPHVGKLWVAALVVIALFLWWSAR